MQELIEAGAEMVVSYLGRGEGRRADAGRGGEEEAEEHGREECPAR
jgi:hypothetical protein